MRAPNHEENNPRDLGIPQIGMPQGQRITCEADIERFVELPARDACIDLFQKNILTVSSSAHDGELASYIDIDAESLSGANATVLRALIEEDQAELVKVVGDDQVLTAKIKVNNLSSERTPEDISRALLNITNNFDIQPLTRGFYTLEEAKKMYGYAPEEYDEVSVDDFVAEGLVLDERTGMLFESQELIGQYRIGAEEQ